MSDELDEIQGIFFEECAEGLATAEAGLSAMQAGDAGAETIAGVFRAVHSIKGGAGAFGHSELTAFAHKFENLLDEVRAGRIPPTSGVVRVMLTAFDVLSDHVAAAQGSAERPADAAALAALEEILANKGAPDDAPAPDSAPAIPPAGAETAEVDPFGFVPVHVELDELESAPPASSSDWRIRFAPSRAALANAGEPLLIIRELESHGGMIEAVDTSALPPLRDLDPEESYFVWTLTAPASVDEADIRDCFDFVAPDSEIEIERGTPAAAEPEPPVMEILPAIEALAELAAPLRLAEVPAEAPAKAQDRGHDSAAQTIRVDLAKLDLLLINPGGAPVALPGEETREPVFGLPALWIDRGLRDEAGFRGLTVVDCGTIIATHLTELVKDNIADLLSYTETQKLLTDVHKEAEKLVADIIPSKISVSGVQRVLQNLLSEGISVRDLPTILEGIAEAAPLTSSITQMTEHVRGRLARQISASNTKGEAIPVVTLSSEWDQTFTESIVGNGDDRQLAMPPSALQGFIAAVRQTYDRLAAEGEIPCLLTNPSIRPFVRSIIERVRPATVVLSQNEIHARARIRALGTVG